MAKTVSTFGRSWCLVVACHIFLSSSGGSMVTSWAVLPNAASVPARRGNVIFPTAISGQLVMVHGAGRPSLSSSSPSSLMATKPAQRPDGAGVPPSVLLLDDNRNDVTVLMNGTSIYIDLGRENKFDGDRPDASWNLAWSNFLRQGRSILQQATDPLRRALLKNKDDDKLRFPDVLGLRLSNQAVTEAEERRIAVTGGVPNVHPVSQGLYQLGCAMLDTLFDERPIPRFWFLEVVARIPYFSYVSMLHLYESLGWWRAVELRKVHAAEEWNELHHLLIMESLGGNALWSDRFLAYHAAIVYYWALNLVFLGSPRVAYQFMELLESHAVDTYTTFCQVNKERLQSLPPPPVAVSYYASGDLYLFDDFQVSRAPGSRRPPCDSLYDVFCNIAVDEGEHVKTMAACQDYAVSGKRVVSPHVSTSSSSLADAETKRRLWKEWSEQINTPRSTEMEGY